MATNIFDERQNGGADLLGHAIFGVPSRPCRDRRWSLRPMPRATIASCPVPMRPLPRPGRTKTERRRCGCPRAGLPRGVSSTVSAGGDINPYLLIAAILGAALNGLEDHEAPPPRITGNAYAQNLPQLPQTWDAAIAAFAEAPEIRRIFTPGLIDKHARHQAPGVALHGRVVGHRTPGSLPRYGLRHSRLRGRAGPRIP